MLSLYKNLQTGSSPLLGKFPAFAVFVILSLILSGCASGVINNKPADPLAAQYGDRCYIEDEEFIIADKLYDTFGTLQLVERELRFELQWKPCQINEALYRLKKVHDLQ